jgi:arylsulfatase A-like enzyme
VNLKGDLAMEKPTCIYWLQLDEVRADHLSSYGYHRKQKYMEMLAKDGVVFDCCITSSSYTGIITISTHGGMMPCHSGVRDPFHYSTTPLMQEYLQKAGWKTQGCMSQSFAGSMVGMSKGFDTFIEPTDPRAPDAWGDGKEHWGHLGIQVSNMWHAKPVGKWYVDENINFLRKVKGEFYLYNQFYETHLGSEGHLLSTGKIKEGEMPENAYYDAKIKLADEAVLGSVIEELKAMGRYEEAVIIVCSDHGTNLKEENWPMGDYILETVGHEKVSHEHSGLYDVDSHIPLIIKAPNIPDNARGRVIKGQVRSIDIMPTILDLIGFPSDAIQVPLDGESLLPCMRDLKGHGKRAYAETLWAPYGMGARQMLREDNWKYIRFLSSMTEEFYDLKKDPSEQCNLVEKLKSHAPKWLKTLREECNDYYRGVPKGIQRREMPEKERKAVQERLRRLGYVTE